MRGMSGGTATDGRVRRDGHADLGTGDSGDRGRPRDGSPPVTIWRDAALATHGAGRERDRVVFSHSSSRSHGQRRRCSGGADPTTMACTWGPLDRRDRRRAETRALGRLLRNPGHTAEDIRRRVHAGRRFACTHTWWGEEGPRRIRSAPTRRHARRRGETAVLATVICPPRRRVPS